MGFLRNSVTSRFPALGRLGDLVLVGGVVLRLANRRGLISDQTAAKFGAPSSSGGSGLSIAEITLAGAAALRLLKGMQKRRT